MRPRRAHIRRRRGCPSGHDRPAWVATDNVRIHKAKGAKRAPQFLLIVGIERCGGGGIQHTGVAEYRQRRLTRPRRHLGPNKPKTPESSRIRLNTDTICRCVCRFPTPDMHEAGHEHPASPAISLVGDEGFEPPTSSV